MPGGRGAHWSSDQSITAPQGLTVRPLDRKTYRGGGCSTLPGTFRSLDSHSVRISREEPLTTKFTTKIRHDGRISQQIQKSPDIYKEIYQKDQARRAYLAASSEISQDHRNSPRRSGSTFVSRRTFRNRPGAWT